MKYLKMEVGLLEPIARTIFFHPSDRFQIDFLVKSDDIKKVETKWMASNHCVITPDVEVELKMESGMTNADFINNGFTIVFTNYFK